MENKFYGKAFGPWIPMLFMVTMMIVLTVTGHGGLQKFALISFIAIAIGFFLYKDKKEFGKISLKGLQNPMLGTIVMAFLMAGILAQLLRQSGLIDSLMYLVAKFEINVGFLPLVSFIVCMFISTSCGTSSGSVAAVAPVLLPLAASLDVNLGLMCGAIISGAIFGDNVAPISDTTIGSALTQEAKINDVVRTRIPYAVTSAIISMILFVIIGMKLHSGTKVQVELDNTTLKPLILLILPIIMVIMMRKGWELIGTLIVCNIVGIVINLSLGCIPINKMFSVQGPLTAGMEGMLQLILYVLLLFQVLEMLISSGAFDKFGDTLMKFCKTPRAGELVCYVTAAVGSAASGGSGIAIMFFGSLVRKITKTFKIERTRGANILDGVACGATGLLPYGNPVILSLGVIMTLDNVDPNFSFLDIMPYTFHCWGLLIIFFISIVTGIGRKFEKD